MDKVFNIAHKTVASGLIIFTGMAAVDVVQGYNRLLTRAKNRREAAERAEQADSTTAPNNSSC